VTGIWVTSLAKVIASPYPLRRSSVIQGIKAAQMIRKGQVMGTSAELVRATPSCGTSTATLACSDVEPLKDKRDGKGAGRGQREGGSIESGADEHYRTLQASN
jgi:hypothetical protein